MIEYKLENGILSTPSGQCTMSSEVILPQLVQECVEEITRLQAELEQTESKMFDYAADHTDLKAEHDELKALLGDSDCPHRCLDGVLFDDTPCPHCSRVREVLS